MQVFILTISHPLQLTRIEIYKCHSTFQIPSLLLWQDQSGSLRIWSFLYLVEAHFPSNQTELLPSCWWNLFLTKHFHKNNNPRPGKDATRPESTDGKQNELNDRRITEKDTKLVKNRNKITKDRLKRCKTEKPQHCLIPASYLSDILPFC